MEEKKELRSIFIFLKLSNTELIEIDYLNAVTGWKPTSIFSTTVQFWLQSPVDCIPELIPLLLWVGSGEQLGLKNSYVKITLRILYMLRFLASTDVSDTGILHVLHRA